MARQNPFVPSDEVAPQTTTPIKAPRPVSDADPFQRFLQQMGGVPSAYPITPSTSSPSPPATPGSGLTPASSLIPPATASSVQSSSFATRTRQDSPCAAPNARYFAFGLGPLPRFSFSAQISPAPLRAHAWQAPTAAGTYPVAMEGVRRHRRVRATWMDYDGDVVMTPGPDLQMPRRMRPDEIWAGVSKFRRLETVPAWRRRSVARKRRLRGKGKK
ncbi:hypothetical protein ABW21_db0206840 [Orbilia brochopaga]|nr:hypothetical protein ABW21_db0206840 [Drechslerella brochopaga]